ncbi:LysR family transcriptional regulator [Vibrio coralliilyticus]|uniref:LysR family transcriptional regulator n=1 Tax=Vibrio coralliilyticus TaxID=190893 RepID=UPI00148C3EEE|nr:LysR family transcriptional regulator [Vibrio coralliilyticus]NOH55401.1 LysR family transcriptional regulator [Vibrio coralliilyticus]
MRHLKAFHAFHIAASSSSYTQAADQLNLTHGAVSKQIKTLEQYLDKRLFHKQGRNVVLTEEGQLLKSYTEQAFGALSAGVAKLHSLDAHSLEVSCEPTLTMRWLMPKLDEFYSQTGTDVRLSTAGGPINLVNAGLDVAIRRDDFPILSHYQITSLVEEWAGPVCTKEYWESIQGNIQNAKVLHSQTRLTAWQEWLNASSISGVTTKSQQSFAHFYFCLQAASDGLGIAIGSYPLVHHDIQQGRLIAPMGFSLTGHNYVAIQTADHHSPLSTPFVSWLKSEMSNCLPCHYAA